MIVYYNYVEPDALIIGIGEVEASVGLSVT